MSKTRGPPPRRLRSASPTFEEAALASICMQVPLDVPAAVAWDALRDWGALHERLAPGFATDVRVEGEDRVVTFFTGAALRERIIAVDDENRRLAWSIVDGPYAHHNGGATIREADRGCVFEWITDLLPHAAEEQTRAMMERALAVIKQTLESRDEVDAVVG